MNETAASPHPFRILLVEDNDDDVLLTRNAFRQLPLAIELYVAHDGVEALKFLRNEAPHELAPLPHIILLDLNMPRMNGQLLLAELKQDQRLKIIPTVILTTSDADADIASAYRNNASAYITKPMDIHEFAYRTRCFANFWLSDVAILPTGLNAS
jgi:two-component system, chemotaxis family, response regulator Rcp1